MWRAVLASKKIWEFIRNARSFFLRADCWLFITKDRQLSALLRRRGLEDGMGKVRKWKKPEATRCATSSKPSAGLSAST